jgi:putative lipoprotein
MRGLMLLFTLHFGGPIAEDDHAGGDRWLSSDKAKHFFTAAFVQSASYSALRFTGSSRTGSLVGAGVVAGAASVGKEIYDSRAGGSASVKDLTWDAAGMAAATALVRRTPP